NTSTCFRWAMTHMRVVIGPDGVHPQVNPLSERILKPRNHPFTRRHSRFCATQFSCAEGLTLCVAEPDFTGEKRRSSASSSATQCTRPKPPIRAHNPIFYANSAVVAAD